MEKNLHASTNACNIPIYIKTHTAIPTLDGNQTSPPRVLPVLRPVSKQKSTSDIGLHIHTSRPLAVDQTFPRYNLNLPYIVANLNPWKSGRGQQDHDGPLEAAKVKVLKSRPSIHPTPSAVATTWRCGYIARGRVHRSKRQEAQSDSSSASTPEGSPGSHVAHWQTPEYGSIGTEKKNEKMNPFPPPPR